jgi:hypothetical protein
VSDLYRDGPTEEGKVAACTDVQHRHININLWKVRYYPFA